MSEINNKQHKVRILEEILIEYFDRDSKLNEPSFYNAYERLIELLNSVSFLAYVSVNDVVDALDSICDINIPTLEHRISCYEPLDDILIKYFGSGFPFPEAQSCDSYGKLVELLYEIGDLTEYNGVIADMIETLDNICNEGAVRDDDGELIYDEQQVREILAQRAKEEVF